MNDEALRVREERWEKAKNRGRGERKREREREDFYSQSSWKFPVLLKANFRHSFLSPNADSQSESFAPKFHIIRAVNIFRESLTGMRKNWRVWGGEGTEWELSESLKRNIMHEAKKFQQSSFVWTHNRQKIGESPIRIFQHLPHEDEWGNPGTCCHEKINSEKYALKSKK